MRNYKEEAISLLKNLEENRMAESTLSVKVAAIHSVLTSPRISSCSPAPVHGGGNRFEDKLIGGINEKDELKKRIREIRSEIGAIEAVLGKMDPEEIVILEKFYIRRQGDHVRELKEMLSYERTSVYRKKDQALSKFIYLYFGVRI